LKTTKLGEGLIKMENGKWKIKLPLQREGSEGWCDFKIEN